MGQLNTIVVLGRLGNRHEEFPANAALSPGHVLSLNSSAKVLKNATQGAAWNRFVAKEDALQGKTIADAYAANDIVMVHIAMPGDIVAVLADPGAAGNYAIGDQLILSGTAGQVKKLSAVTTGVTVRNVIGEVVEARNLSTTGAVTALVKMRVY